MDGGIINIWMEKPLSESDKELLKKYSTYISSFSAYFDIRFKELKIRSHNQKKQILTAIGYIPKYEIQLVGFVDKIFPAAEAILREFGGFLSLNIGATLNQLRKTKGEFHHIKNTRLEYFLIDWKVTANYFNVSDSEEVREVFSLSKFEKETLFHFYKN